MTNEQQAAFIMAQAAVLNGTIAQMQAENKACETVGASPTYSSQDFKDTINTSNCTHNQVLQFFQEQQYQERWQGGAR